MKEYCEHGYGGFFKCPKGCHSEGPAKDLEEIDRDLDYFYKRIKAHGISTGFEEPERDLKPLYSKP